MGARADAAASLLLLALVSLLSSLALGVVGCLRLFLSLPPTHTVTLSCVGWSVSMRVQVCASASADVGECVSGWAVVLAGGRANGKQS